MVGQCDYIACVSLPGKLYAYCGTCEGLSVIRPIFQCPKCKKVYLHPKTALLFVCTYNALCLPFKYTLISALWSVMVL